MKTKLLFTVALAALTILPSSAQSKEQREQLRQWPFTFRVKVGKVDSKQSKSESGGTWGGSSETLEKTMHWTAAVDLRMTNMPEKVEVKTYYIGTRDGELAVLGTDTFPVELNEKGHASVDITSPTVKSTKTKGGGNFRGIGVGSMQNNNNKQKSQTGERLEGLAAQLLVNDVIVKTYVQKPIWQKGCWANNPTEDDFDPMKNRSSKIGVK